MGQGLKDYTCDRMDGILLDTLGSLRHSAMHPSGTSYFPNYLPWRRSQYTVSTLRNPGVHDLGADHLGHSIQKSEEKSPT